MILQAINPRGTLQKNGEEAAVGELRLALLELKKRIFDPLKLDRFSYQHLYLCPDNSFWLVPWSVIPIESEEFLIEKSSIQLLISGRQLLPKATSTAATQPAVIFANPVDDMAPSNVWKSTVETLEKLAPSEVDRQGSFKRTPNTRYSKLPALPGAVVEADLITPDLKRWTGLEIIRYFERQALESVARRLKHPKVVVFGTHAFFHNDENSAVQGSTGKPPAYQVAVNPLNRFGLLFAGCKDRNAGNGTAGDDGILTGSEIVGIDFWGTDLVIFSACETVLGTVRDGVGVAGLSQAFQLAGANQFVGAVVLFWPGKRSFDSTVLCSIIGRSK